MARMRMGRDLSTTVFGFFVLFVIFSMTITEALRTVIWFIGQVAPYVAGAVGLFLVVVIVLRVLNAWKG